MDSKGNDIVFERGSDDTRWVYVGTVDSSESTPFLNGVEHVGICYKDIKDESFSSDTNTLNYYKYPVYELVREWIAGVKETGTVPLDICYPCEKAYYPKGNGSAIETLKNGFWCITTRNQSGDELNKLEGIALASDAKVALWCFDNTDETIRTHLDIVRPFSDSIASMFGAASENIADKNSTQLYTSTIDVTPEESDAMVQYAALSGKKNFKDGDVLIFAAKFKKNVNAGSRPTKRSVKSSVSHKKRIVRAIANGDHKEYRRAVSAAKPHLRLARTLPDSLDDAAVVLENLNLEDDC